MSGTTSRHAPAADNCTTCHDVSVTDDGTTVSLTASDPDLCLMCHDTFEAAAGGTLESPHAAVLDGCTSCHSPHASDHESLLVASDNALCFSCHDVDETDDRHQLPVRRSDCTGCHAPHGSDATAMLAGRHQHPPFAEGSCDGCHRRPRGTAVRMAETGSALCFACHGDLEERFSTGVLHGPVSNGACVDCHDPHVSDEPALLRRGGAALCFDCHEDVRAAVGSDGAHAVAVECDTCHDPHRGEVDGLLTQRSPSLCLECHTSDAPLRAKHLDAELGSTDCLGCHDPHGSDRGRLMATGSVHPPYEDGCNGCHQNARADALVADGGSELCFACHSGVEGDIAAAPVPHAALEMARCVDCHTPHASRQPRLLQGRSDEVCGTCHDGMIARADQQQHEVIATHGCRACHEPHGGANPWLLRQTGNDLCLDCHLAGRIDRRSDGSARTAGGIVLQSDELAAMPLIDLDPTLGRDHPLRNHPVSGTITEPKGRTRIAASLIGEEMSCTSCHDPHLGSGPGLLAFGARTGFELCVACHPR